MARYMDVATRGYELVACGRDNSPAAGLDPPPNPLLSYSSDSSQPGFEWSKIFYENSGTYPLIEFHSCNILPVGGYSHVVAFNLVAPILIIASVADGSLEYAFRIYYTSLYVQDAHNKLLVLKDSVFVFGYTRKTC